MDWDEYSQIEQFDVDEDAFVDALLHVIETMWTRDRLGPVPRVAWHQSQQTEYALLILWTWLTQDSEALAVSRIQGIHFHSPIHRFKRAYERLRGQIIWRLYRVRTKVLQNWREER